MNVTRVPMPSRDKYPCKECQKRYPDCHDKCEEMKEAKRINAERKAVERQRRLAEHEVSGYQITRNHAAARRKINER